jgi:hypothetical protein
MEGAEVVTEVATGATGRLRAVTPSCFTTTLYDLIAALQEGVGPDDDALVVATVVHLLRSGRLTWRRQARAPITALAPCGHAEYQPESLHALFFR